MTQHPAPSRRSFLAAAGVLAALPALTYRRALCADTPPSETVRVGAVGVGGQSKVNLPFHLKRIAAVCDVDSKRLGLAGKLVQAATSREPMATADYRTVLDSKDIDAVLLTVPDHWHAVMTIDACNAGKHVYCEKPLTLFIAEGRDMVEAARRNRVVVQTGSQQRSAGEFRRAAELVRNGALGKLTGIRVGLNPVNFAGPAVPDSAAPPELDYERWLGPAPQRPYNAKRVHYLFRFFWDYSGGQLTNFGAHHLDIVQWALGMDESGPVKVSGKARYHDKGWYEVPEWFEVAYTYADGTVVRAGQDFPMGVTFTGEKGTLYVNRGKIQSNPRELLDAPTATKLRVSKDHHADWIECVKSGKTPVADVAIGHRSATVCHLGNVAIRLGRELEWNPATETFPKDSEAQAMTRRPYREPYTPRAARG